MAAQVFLRVYRLQVGWSSSWKRALFAFLLLVTTTDAGIVDGPRLVPTLGCDRVPSLHRKLLHHWAAAAGGGRVNRKREMEMETNRIRGDKERCLFFFFFFISPIIGPISRIIEMTVPEADNPITTSLYLLSSLLAKIPKTQHFRAKWSLIREKLNQFQSHLSEFTDLPDSTSNPLSLELLHSASHNFADAASLADICQFPELSTGKLKTQNDLDSVLAKLDRYIQDADVLIKSGVLLHQNVAAAATSISSSASKRELIRNECRNLITRLQIGSAESKNAAMDSLMGLLQEDDKNVMIAVAQGVVPVLVKHMDSGSPTEIKEKTVAAIARVSVVESSKHILMAEGLLLLNSLLRVLESGSGFAKEKACVALQALTNSSKENARAMGGRGVISSLLEICNTGTPSSQGFAGGVLRNLASVREIRENLMEENAVEVLLGLADSGTALAQENALGCLCNMIAGGEDDILDETNNNLKLWVVREKGIECVKNYWESKSENPSLQVGVSLLSRLTSYPPIGEAIMAEEGWWFIPRLSSALSHESVEVRVAAAGCLYQLGKLSSSARKVIGEGCVIGELTRMLHGKVAEEKESGARALSCLLAHSGNRRLFAKEERGIRSAVELLEETSIDHKYTVRLLMWMVVHSGKCRKQMVSAGALQKLTEMEGAEKLRESLTRGGKFWGFPIFS